MTIDFYYAPFSPPCHPILMVAKALNVELNLKVVNTLAKEHLAPEFIKMNPQHCIPTLVDNGFAIWESRAILTYLVTKYGKGSSLYPEDPQARAVVDQRLYFDMGTLYQRFTEVMYPQLLSNQPVDEAKVQRVEEALEFLNTFLEGNQWVAGANYTVADFAIMASVSNFGTLHLDIFKYPNIEAWYERAKTSLPGYKICEEGAALMKTLIEEIKAKNASA